MVGVETEATNKTDADGLAEFEEVMQICVQALARRGIHPGSPSFEEKLLQQFSKALASKE